MRIGAFLLPFIKRIDADKPNVVILITDDFGIGDFTAYNTNGKVPTPNIDRIGNEGVKFLDGHAGSSRCSPSRFMLMTGRYSLEDSPARKLYKGTPHLAEMFKRNGYSTGIFGKYQPLHTVIENIDITPAEANAAKQAQQEYNIKTYGSAGISKTHKQWIPRGMFNTLGRYEQTYGPNDHSYDYSFTSSSLCCQAGAYYENGKGIEPVSKYVIQRPYPEGSEKQSSIDPVTGKCSEYPITGYMGAPYFDTPIENGPYLHCNFPLMQVSMPSFDSRTIEDAIVPKARNFIRERAQSNQPFFMFYGMRSGHRPFNTPLRYRGKSKAGLVGEMILEADEIVGEIMNELKQNGVDDNTIILFLSDNGPDGSAYYAKKDFGHLQNGLDVNGETIELRGQKNLNYEGGHRVPFLWRWPKRWTAKTISDPNIPVSYLDVYRTMADILGDDLPCHEAPDSRSILKLLDGDEPPDNLKRSKIFTHAKNGARIAFRQRKWKWLPDKNELYNLENDLQETTNLAFDECCSEWATRMNETMHTILHAIELREEKTEKGKIHDCHPIDNFV